MIDMNKIGFDNWLTETLKQDKELAKMFLKGSIEDFKDHNDINILLSSLRNVAKAMGWTYLEKETGISRQALYTALSEKGNPRVRTFMMILDAFGLKMSLN